eukprot:CAMPEP_0172800352 /NCGR_PEP_ID=MMETSP1075-20121228/2532_1 /TAXON_ID=2916 /ORGANISM="Ceratium fusus, Strain PA161109" /LENGTH=530 /DNA_ID=CAMNT_0013638245 /DNA_START=76 /DNA_END=1668 /DNA_ORIENTATION=-
MRVVSKTPQETPTEAERRCRPLYVLAVVSNAALLPAALFCATHWALFVLTWILGIFSFVLAGLTWRVKRHSGTHHCQKRGVRGFCRDMIQVIRLAFTILLPILMASFDGASFVLAVYSESISPRANNCSVRQLSQLDAAGFMSFSCVDGFIAVDLQIGVPAWDGATPGEGRVLTGFGAVHSMHRSMPGHRPMNGHRPMHGHRPTQVHRSTHGLHRPMHGHRHTQVHRSTHGFHRPMHGHMPNHGLHNIPNALLPRLHRPQRNIPSGDIDSDVWIYPGQVAQPAEPRSPAVVAAEARAVASHTVGKSEGNRFGFVAPIYVSLDSFEAGDGPVLWAVKAGSPVKRSNCRNDVRILRTCGMFALRLQDEWGQLPGPPHWFGRRWGLNISHFSKEQMLAARREVIRRFPDLNLTGIGETTFVVAEDAQQYFARSFCNLWVAAALMILGFMDRIVDLFSTETAEEDKGEEDGFKPVQDGINSWEAWGAFSTDEPPMPQTSPCMLAEAHQFWADALGPTPRDDSFMSCRTERVTHL